ncbi:LysR substrate-binding domain-containing protein [Rhodococcus sp. B10]|uniref:LysR family transcriptional regulator n=1 Tax=Rhodococcus sp. B10 TaxID=2695876 RepID=UPI00142F69FE|nr:LysR substrate-binding domain-containing protein [Rhodococcus sp. B10]NIL77343.1 HTH-type transcriptional regulator BenM [Rhodococcus sp. B10]
MVEIRQARYFIAVAEELHFGRAATRLNMSQPPLSQAIRQLEKELSVPLLQRSSRAVTLTPAGSVFLEHCRTLVDQSSRAGIAALQAHNGFLGEVAIGAVTSAFTTVLPRILEAYRSSRPGVNLKVREIDTSWGADAVTRHELDIAIIRATGSRGLRALPLRRDRFVVAVPASHRLAAQRGPVDLEMFSDDSWVWLPREISPSYHDDMAATCRHAGFSPQAQHLASSITSQLAMVACGLGVTIVPHSSAVGFEGSVVFRQLRAPDVALELSLICRDVAEPLVDHFIDCAVGTAPAYGTGHHHDLPGS